MAPKDTESSLPPTWLRRCPQRRRAAGGPPAPLQERHLLVRSLQPQFHNFLLSLCSTLSEEDVKGFDRVKLEWANTLLGEGSHLQTKQLFQVGFDEQ